MRLNPLDGNLLFQSTLSVRRATYELPGRISDVKFQSTLSVRRATRWRRGMPGCMGISIHALRKESDFSGWLRRGRRSYFNPRSP